MKGLLVKDVLLTVKVQGKTFALLVLFALFMAFAMDNPFFIVSYLTFICSIFSINAMIYDEMNNGYAFLFTLPVNAKSYVTSKYIFSTVLTVLSAVISYILAFVLCIFKGKEELISEGKMVLITIISIVIVYLAVLLPLELKFSSEKSRAIIFGVLGAMVAIAYAIIVKIQGNSALTEKLVKIIYGMEAYQMALSALVLCAIILFISYMISLKIMKEKEF